MASGERRTSEDVCALIVGLTLVMTGCDNSPGLKDALFSRAGNTALDAGAPPDAGEVKPAAPDGGEEQGACIPAVASDPLHARSSVMSRGASKSRRSGVFTADLFGLFQANCGGCHVDNSLGGLEVSLLTFPDLIDAKALERLVSDDPKTYMPPSNREPFSKLGPNDPLVELAKLLEAWLAAGRPEDVFYPPGSVASGDDANRYLLSEAVGTQMTNLGNCIPPKRMVRDASKQDDDELDAMFAAATTLPERLEQTDVVSLDAEVLARQGVVAFAPAYTLWADNAKKIRLVRVPRGKSIAFDAKTQTFDIPANTRFYKTFLKRVVDLKGHESYRKMETRLIVSRPDTVGADGTVTNNAVFGTYAWNDAETEAVLVQDPLRNRKPFRDRVTTYVLDEHAAEALITTGPANLQEALEERGLSRSYAIPGSERCIQCHMGAPTKSFILGFSPLQLYRRELGQGGVIEPAERDELNQLQRLIDYGVITGMKSPDEVALLEDSQGKRDPRNEHELAAQGYMLGNCSHCHNPRGFPSKVAPELRDTLDFMPSEHGGIFQFPLEQFSPRIFRGVYQNVPQPYITPGLYDRPRDTDLPGPIHVGKTDIANYLAKELVYFVRPDEWKLPPLLAPWRSLIYRNVDAPFTYEEDSSIYPHMPMNTPGYDCRARQLLGSWMVSIPARMKLPKGADALTYQRASPEAQPYEEAFPGDADYAANVRFAARRTADFEASPRYSDCPAPSVDIVDPAVARGEVLVPRPENFALQDAEGTVIGGYSVRAPARPHFANTDLTNPPGDWNPRRSDWSSVLVDKNFENLPAYLPERVLWLQDLPLSDAMRTYALTELPFAIWREKATCDLSSQPTVASFTSDQRPRWMDVTKPKPDEHVYSISPGAQVFTMICANCHGPLADSSGRLAATIADMTGGQTRVANLRDGFFGPVDIPGQSRDRVFAGAAAATGLSSELWAARYLVFMGLGGTQSTIPAPALQTIRNGTVYGSTRLNPSVLDVSNANMLSVPVALCEAVLPGTLTSFLPVTGDLDYSASAAEKSPLIATNGDLELWRRLCSLDNATIPVRVVAPKAENSGSFAIDKPFSGSLRHRSSYPAGAPVGDQRGGVQNGIMPGNEAPWCFERPTADDLLKLVKDRWEQHAGVGAEPPYCPAEFLDRTDNHFNEQDGKRWAIRGAMNAGLAVFLYLDALAEDRAERPIPYDRCEELKN